MVQAICDTGALVSAAHPPARTENGSLRVVMGRLHVRGVPSAKACQVQRHAKINAHFRIHGYFRNHGY